MHRRLFALIVSFTASALGAQASHDPARVALMTDDIPRFWAAYDASAGATDTLPFRLQYLDSGSAGVRAFIPNRIQSAARLAGTIRRYQRYYESIRGGSLALDTATAFKQAIRVALTRFADADADAKFPPAYFVVGAWNSGGTTSRDAVIIGVEVNGNGPDVVLDELNAWARSVIGTTAELPFIVTHEYVHTQQRGPRDDRLLTRSLREGGADFLAELFAGPSTVQSRWTYGNAHEAELWARFQTQMLTKDASDWLYDGNRAQGHPADLGYYMGYRITRAYYEKATDKRAAVRAILRIADAEAFLAESGYPDRFTVAR